MRRGRSQQGRALEHPVSEHSKDGPDRHLPSAPGAQPVRAGSGAGGRALVPGHVKD